MSHQYTIQLNRLPGASFVFNRVNILLGSNGTGKSKLLQEIRGKANNFGSKPVIYVEGGRTINIVDTLQLTHGNFQQYSSLEQAKLQHDSKYAGTLSSRFQDALFLIDLLGQQVLAEHSRSVTEWQKTGQIGECPYRAEHPVERLFSLFNEIFPSITLNYNPSSKQLTCIKNGNSYSPSQFSDGEKQIFSLLADIVITGSDNRLILIDEPELNLNPGLANRFWDLIENELTDSVFIYATHSVSFSMRANVEKIYVLSNESTKIAEIENISEIEERELPALLGCIPAILSSNRAIAVEGREDSMDTIIYRWLVEPKDTEIVAVGGCEDVKAVANKTGVWDRLATSVKILGIIDRDFKTQNLLDSFKKTNCLTLDYHEIESYLCLPDIVVQVALGIGSVEKKPTKEEITQLIVDEFKKELIQIVARRVFARSTIKLGVSIEKGLLKNINNQATLEETLVKAAADEIFKATTELSSENIKAITQEELEICNSAISNGSIHEILRLMPAKGIINKIAPLVGCRNDTNYARAVTKHVRVSDIPELIELQSALNK